MTTKSIQVSIIMPVRNAGKYLHECLLSIREQTFTFWELIIVNDHSTDDTTDILAIHASEDSRIRWIHNTGEGITPALQLALDHAKGQFITRMDGDDLMPQNRLELMVTTLIDSPSKTVVTGLAEYFCDSEVSEGYQTYEDWLNQRAKLQDHWLWVYRECVVASPNWMMRTEELRAMDGFAPLSYPEDYHLVLKWYEYRFEIQAIPQTTLRWREHSERTSRNSEHYDQAHFFKLKVNHFIKYSLGNSQLVLWGAGNKGRLTAEILDQHDQSFTWMDMKPEKYPNGIFSHSIQSFRQTEKLTDFKVLISVYPPEKERVKLEKYLTELDLTIGQNYWYL